jgi:hypothetical protein
MTERWEVVAWVDYSAAWPGTILDRRTFDVAEQQAEHDPEGAFGVARKWPDRNLLDPEILSLRRVHPPIPPVGATSDGAPKRGEEA